MTTAEERMQILKMLKEGKISVEEADSLLSAIGEEREETAIVQKGRAKAKFLKVLISGSNGEVVKVNVPISLVRLAMNFMPEEAKRKINMKQIDVEEIIRQVEEGAEGKLVEIGDPGGDKVEVWVE